jgi:putative secretion ATPase (PEP-CTERM system associated)
MYERFYNLRERPFSLSPDPDYLYPSRVHTEALNYLRYGIEGHAGFVVITGEIGSGKTTLLQAALRGLDTRTAVARLVNTMLDARELIEAIMLDFGLEPQPGASKPHLLRDLARFLVEQRNAGRLALLIIDEAQNLSHSALEEVRMLSNLETEKSKLIQIVLVGQPNLHDGLARPEFEQLRQRITVRYHLRPLDAGETAAYINHRLKKASIGAPLVFPAEATDLIGQYSEGLPRKINVIADAVLLFGYGEDKKTIDAPLVQEVLAELEATGVIVPPAAVEASSPPGVAGVAAAATAPARAVIPPIAAAPIAAAPIAAAPIAAAPVAAAPVAAVAPSVIDRELAAREARIAARERELAEQQRILTEQYRLLKAREAQTLAQSAAATTWPPRRPAGATPAAGVPSAATAAASGARAVRVTPPQTMRVSVTREPLRAPLGFWARVRRAMSGVGKPLLED